MKVPSSKIEYILEGSFVVDSGAASQEDEYGVLLLEVFT
jgi:hypothetical protein